MKTLNGIDVLRAFERDVNNLNRSPTILLDCSLLSIYAEYLTSQLIEKYIGHDLGDKKELDQNLKLKILHGIKVIKDIEYSTLNALREVRNHMIHNLEINIEKLKNIMDQIKVLSEFPDFQNRIKGNVEYTFKMACVTRLTIMLAKFYKINCQFNWEGDLFKIKIDNNLESNNN